VTEDERPDDEGESEVEAEARAPSPIVEAPMVRTALIVGPLLACVGIVWTALAPSNASSAAILVGVLTAIVATHRFGRRGPPVGVNEVL